MSWSNKNGLCKPDKLHLLFATSEETLWPQIERREDESGIALVEVHTNKLKFKAPATSSEPQIVLVSVNEGILSTNTFFF